MPEEGNGAGAPQGLSWSWELDFDTLMAAIADAGPSGTASPGDGPARENSADGPARENSAPCAACLADDAASQEAVQGVIPGRATAAQDGQDDPEPTDEAGGMPAWVPFR